MLKGVNLDVGPGERLGIVGTSGSGKSTLLRLILGELRAVAGTIEILGRDAASWSFDRRRRVLGVVFQQDGLLGEATALQNVMLGARTGPNLAGAASGLLSSLGIDHEAQERRPGGLSGGQRRRVALARCAADPRPIMLFDEPSSGLDPDSAADVAHAIVGLAAEHGSCCVTVTHDEDLARRACTRIVRLTDGRLEAWPPDLTSPPETEARTAPARGPAAGREPGGETAGTPDYGTSGPYNGLDVFCGQLKVFLATACPLLIASAFVMGFTVLLQSIGAARIPFDRFVDVERPLIRAVLNGLLFDVTPLTMGLLYAGVGGASIAGHIASMSALGELDSLRWAGGSPGRLLLAPMLAVSVVGFSLAIIPSWIAAVIGSAAAVSAAHTLVDAATVHAIARDMLFLSPHEFSAATLKALAFACITVVAGYGIGRSLTRGSPGIAHRAALAALAASAAIVLGNAGFTVLLD